MDGGDGPARTRWQEVLLAVLAVTESGAFLLLDDHPFSPWAVTRALLVLGCGLALLARFSRWRTLLPALLAVNAVVGSLLVMIVAPYAYASRAPRRRTALAIAALAATAALLPPLLHRTLDPLGGPSRGFLALVTVSVVLVVAVSTILGMDAGTRRQLVAGLRLRAVEAEAQRAEAQEQARRAERTRIAREMHDIVAHKISLVALQAGALEVNPEMDREKVQQTASLIRTTATEALSELREVLGVLRGADDDAPLAPQPTWEDVRRLVTTSRAAGITVDLFDFVDDPVPDVLARTVYRVVQEGLTNIHKHARQMSARVALIGEPGQDLVVEVSNVLPQGFTSDLPGARMGLSGIETRVAHAGGRMTSGPTDDGRFLVKAVIPWPMTAA